jgi:hypothetical protein
MGLLAIGNLNGRLSAGASCSRRALRLNIQSILTAQVRVSSAKNIFTSIFICQSALQDRSFSMLVSQPHDGSIDFLLVPCQRTPKQLGGQDLGEMKSFHILTQM